MMTIKPLYLSGAVALALVQTAYAHNHQADDKPTVVLDTLNAQFVVPTNVQVLGQKSLKETATQNIDDIMMYEAGVDVGSDNERAGHHGFSIRGINGNRILMTVDGVPMPDAHQDSVHSRTPNVGRDTIETDTVKSVRIIKGGNGTAQGDGALGGSVNMQTTSPNDLVNDDKTWHVGLKYGYRSTYKSHGATATAAIKHGMFSALTMLTQRKLHEATNFPAQDSPELGRGRTQSNKQDSTQRNILLKAQIDSDNHQLEAVAERFSRQTDTELSTRQGKATSLTGKTSETTRANAQDHYKRLRYGVTYRFLPDNLFFDVLSVNAYHQKLQANDTSSSASMVTPPPAKPNTSGGGSAGGTAPTPPAKPSNQDIANDNVHEQGIWGIQPEIKKTWQMGNTRHDVLFGGEYRRTKTSRLLVQDTNDSVAGNTNNTRSLFPPADRTVLSAYAQDNVRFGNGATLGLGLRYEAENTVFDFDDPAYLNSVIVNTVDFDKLSNRALLPSLGLSYPLGQGLTGSFAYRRGYRLPSVNVAAVGWSNTGHRYRVVANPDLKPETSDNYELGLRLDDDKVNASFGVFYHDYRNFVDLENITHLGGLPKGYSSQYRYNNVLKARTYGLEGKLSYWLTDNLKTTGSFAWIDAKNKTSNTPLNSSYPLNGVLAVDYEQERWDLGAKLRMAQKNHKVPQGYFKTPGYAVLDLVASFRPTDNISLGAGVYNVTNKRYWTSADTYGVSEKLAKELYTQPPRNFAVNAEFKF